MLEIFKNMEIAIDKFYQQAEELKRKEIEKYEEKN